MQRIAIWASGGGSNAACIIEHLVEMVEMEVALIVTNRQRAGVRDKGLHFGIPDVVISKEELQDESYMMDVLIGQYKIDYIVLAGWLLLVPPYIVEAFRGRMINIHPALLPAYGGKGMYGRHVHTAVHAAGERYSGITIHHVTEAYDEGSVILQAKVELLPSDSVDDIAQKVLALEHRYYPIVIEELVKYGSHL